MTKEELLPCPLCGSAFKIGQEPHDNGSVGGMFYIYHDYGPLGSAARKCRLSINGHFGSQAEAITAWNQRPEATDRIAALEAENARLREALGVYAGPIDDTFDEKPYPYWANGYPGGVFIADNTLDFGDIAREVLRALPDGGDNAGPPKTCAPIDMTDMIGAPYIDGDGSPNAY